MKKEYVIEYRRIPLAHTSSQYISGQPAACFLALTKAGTEVEFNESANRHGLDDQYCILCVYEVVGDTKKIHYQYDLWGGVRHISDQLKAELRPALVEVFA